MIFTGAKLPRNPPLRWEDVDLERGLLALPDSKTGKKAIVLNAPAMTVLPDLPHLGAYVIAGQDAGTEKEKPRADLNKPWRSVATLRRWHRQGTGPTRRNIEHRRPIFYSRVEVEQFAATYNWKPSVQTPASGHFEIGLCNDLQTDV